MAKQQYETCILAESRPFYQIKHGGQRHLAQNLPKLPAAQALRRSHCLHHCFTLRTSARATMALHRLHLPDLIAFRKDSPCHSLFSSIYGMLTPLRRSTASAPDQPSRAAQTP
ncbi:MULTISPECIES: hypothetical protein [unclassified Janthinobacterium]|uniref:hypothetical protein n=1 Tax=unclassified Janthinobacterium TaxID=2610881 RepID=UPI00161043F2|nr:MULTISPECIES: hypothetical protein [unclassified Janthinobacterium]MBB5607776.1 hypothetical protein [Janthinobacterium sp. S3T4]MBB5613075.1 hypothetical protein [Janthinobacterium sp. S3M3]